MVSVFPSINRRAGVYTAPDNTLSMSIYLQTSTKRENNTFQCKLTLPEEMPQGHPEVFAADMGVLVLLLAQLV